MAGKTVSAYADEETARRVEHMARVEQRPVSQIASAALAFYARLPAEAHAALRAIEAHGGPAALDRAARAVARRLLDAQFEVAARGAAAAISDETLAGLGALHAEDDVLAAAVGLTTSDAPSDDAESAGRAADGNPPPRPRAAPAKRPRRG